MLGRLKLTLVITAAAVILAPAAQIAAQDGGRFKVLIPYFTPLEDAKDKFGKTLGKLQNIPKNREIIEHFCLDTAALDELVQRAIVKSDN